MKINPLSNYVLIQPVKQEEKTESGIFLPQTASREMPEQGKVVAVGPGKLSEDNKLIPLTVKEGDMVLFTKYGPNEIKINGKEYLMAKEEDILGIITDN